MPVVFGPSELTDQANFSESHMIAHSFLADPRQLAWTAAVTRVYVPRLTSDLLPAEAGIEEEELLRQRHRSSP